MALIPARIVRSLSQKALSCIQGIKRDCTYNIRKPAPSLESAYALGDWNALGRELRFIAGLCINGNEILTYFNIDTPLSL